MTMLKQDFKNGMKSNEKHKALIKGFEQYELDGDNGTCYNHDTKTFVGYIDKSNGYEYVSLTNGKYKYHRRLHILMAEYFIPHPENKPTVHHMNHDRSDNRVANLAWATYEEQRDSHWKVGNRMQLDLLHEAKRKPIRVFSDGFSHDYDSISEASRALNINSGNLTRVLKGQRKSAGGYQAEYLEE